MGGIRLGLQNENEVISAFETMFTEIGKKSPQAKLDGVLIEQMAGQGQEVIIGIRRDPGFGPVIMFGLAVYQWNYLRTYRSGWHPFRRKKP
jgi:acyl-CoA synthetase (NDP forming)